MPNENDQQRQINPHKEIRNPLWRGLIRRTIGAAILLILVVLVWWYFGWRKEDSDNANQITVNANASVVITAPTVTEIKSKFEDDFNFEKHNDVEGRTNWLGIKGNDFIQIFSNNDEVEQITYNFTIGSDGTLTDLQLDLVNQLAERSAGYDYVDWVMEQFENNLENKQHDEFQSQEHFNDWSYYGRVECGSIGTTRYCSTTTRWPSPVLRAQAADNSMFNFEYIGEDEELPQQEDNPGVFF